MGALTADWNLNQTRLREIIKQEDRFGEAIELCLSMHALAHGALTGEIWEGLPDESFSVMPTARDVTIAWNIWHITRIEDITASILVAGGSQVLNDDRRARLGTTVRDTGNAMTDDEIVALSRSLDKDELRKYRKDVGEQTAEILRGLAPADMRRKFPPERVRRILDEGGLTEHPDSIWLLDFWGKKDVAGIILMPFTRHQLGHLNDCLRLKGRILRAQPR